MPKQGFFEGYAQGSNGATTTLVKTMSVSSTFPRAVLQNIIDHAKTKQKQIIKSGETKSVQLGELLPSAVEIDGFFKKSFSSAKGFDVSAYSAAINTLLKFKLEKQSVHTPFDQQTSERLSLLCHTEARQYYQAHPLLFNTPEEQEGLEQQEPTSPSM